jgi:hypothetical protein
MADPEPDQSWTATCQVCGRTERGDDAPSQLGLRLGYLALTYEDSDLSPPPETP